jgi:hypothetical protein
MESNLEKAVGFAWQSSAHVVDRTRSTIDRQIVAKREIAVLIGMPAADYLMMWVFAATWAEAFCWCVPKDVGPSREESLASWVNSLMEEWERQNPPPPGFDLAAVREITNQLAE